MFGVLYLGIAATAVGTGAACLSSEPRTVVWVCACFCSMRLWWLPFLDGTVSPVLHRGVRLLTAGSSTKRTQGLKAPQVCMLRRLGPLLVSARLVRWARAWTRHVHPKVPSAAAVCHALVVALCLAPGPVLHGARFLAWYLFFHFCATVCLHLGLHCVVAGVLHVQHVEGILAEAMAKARTMVVGV